MGLMIGYTGNINTFDLMRSFVLRKMAVMGVVIVMLVLMCFLNGVKHTKETLIRVGVMWFYMRMRRVTLRLMNGYVLTAGECLAATGHPNSHFFTPAGNGSW